MKRVLIIAAGTGGHIFPALAIARILKQKGAEIAWLGTFCGLEGPLISKESIPFYPIQVTGLRGKGFFKTLASVFQLFKAFKNSLTIIRDFNPDIILAMGGFVCGPSGLAAKWLRKKILLHEQNAVLGLTHKILFHLSDKLLTGFPNLSITDKKQKVIYTGNPIREDIERLPPPEVRFKNRSGPLRLLVFGGSQGSASFNLEIPKAIAQLVPAQRPVIWHQSGKLYLEMAEKAYHQAKVDAQVVPFIDTMAEAYQWADLVISRSGAITVAELSAVGLASILIPYPFHADEQQKYNARCLVEKGAAILLPHQSLIAGNLTPLLSDILTSRERLLQMSQSARTLRQENVAEKIARLILTN